MKRLYLLRHAEAERSDWSKADFERSLTERGRRDAALIGSFARERARGIELVLCSPAERARQTATLFLESAGFAPPVVYDERIYEASATRLLRVVWEVADDAQEVLLVGHNPGMAELFELLTNEVPRMPAGALACIALGVEEWNEARDGCGRLELFATPQSVARSEDL